MCVVDVDDEEETMAVYVENARAITVIGGFASTCSFWRHDDTCWRRWRMAQPLLCSVCLLNRHFLSLQTQFVCVCVVRTHQPLVITHFEFCIFFFFFSSVCLFSSFSGCDANAHCVRMGASV